MSKPADCPSERELWAYLEGALESSQEEAISHHVAGCHACLDSLLLAQEVRPGIGFDPREGVKEDLIRKVKALASRKGSPKERVPFRKHRWLLLALVCIGTSFFVPRYFLQCLLLASIFGIKWVFDSAANRTLIVMYETWKKKGVREKEEKTLRR